MELNKKEIKDVRKHSEQPDITRDGSKVIVECHNEEAAVNFQSGIKSAFSSPMIRKMLLKASKRNPIR